jgi:hypothetical protein
VILVSYNRPGWLFGRLKGQLMMKVAALVGLLSAIPFPVYAQEASAYRVLATNKTSTMQKEMQEAGDAGFRFVAVMGGDTVGGKEVVVIMQKTGSTTMRYQYRLLATNKTSTMQKEMQEGAEAGFQYVGQTVFESTFGGKEVVCLLERDLSVTSPPKYEYRLLSTTKTSTMEKELKEAGEGAYDVIGMTVAKTLVGGNELVTITRRKVRE